MKASKVRVLEQKTRKGGGRQTQKYALTWFLGSHIRTQTLQQRLS